MMRLVQKSELIQIVGSAAPYRLYIDGIAARLVIFGSTGNPSPLVAIDGVTVANASEADVVIDWPVVTMSDGQAIPYDQEITLTDSLGLRAIGFLLIVRQVVRP